MENEPTEKSEVQGESGITYEHALVPDPEKGGETHHIEPVGTVFVQGQQGE